MWQNSFCNSAEIPSKPKPSVLLLFSFILEIYCLSISKICTQFFNMVRDIMQSSLWIETVTTLLQMSLKWSTHLLRIMRVLMNVNSPFTAGLHLPLKSQNCFTDINNHICLLGKYLTFTGQVSCSNLSLVGLWRRTTYCHLWIC
jgi:hypothetical protein